MSKRSANGRWFAVAAATFCALCAGTARLIAQQPIHWSISPAGDGTSDAGRVFTVELTATLDPTWHLYATTQPVGGPQPLLVTVPKGPTFSLAGEIGSGLPQIGHDPNFNLDTQFFEERAAFTVPILIAPPTRDGAYRLAIKVAYQTCNDRLCLPPTEEVLAVDAAIASGIVTISTLPLAASPATRLPAPTARVTDMAAASAGAGTLLGYVWLAMAMGALSLLTPCVFPMVPITVSYFSRARQRRRDAVAHAVAYGLAIVLTFTALGVAIALAFGASGLTRFAADPWLNLAVTALFVLFALSLFGVYEPSLPSRLMTATTAGGGQGRLASTMVMGLAFTLTSFTCTAPFLGTLFVVASQGNWQWPLAGMLGFSVVFALPFVVLALAPQLLAALPRSGPWLVAMKSVMGLLELAAAMKFLSNVDLIWGWNIFTRPVVIVSWIVVAGVLAAYLSGAIRLGPAPRLRRPGVARLAAVAGCAVLGAWLGSGLTGHRLGELEAFLPPADLAGTTTSELAWFMNDYDAALAEARREQRPILVDFTGYTCTNCRWMEANMFPKPDVTRELARYVRVRLFTDGRGEMYRRHQQLEKEWFGTVALPYYAVLTSTGEPVVSFGGLTRDANEYLRFLRRGLE